MQKTAGFYPKERSMKVFKKNNRTFISAPSNLWALGVIFLTLFLTTLPYLIGYALSRNRYYLWLGYNLDDACVYLSWMRQATEHYWRQYNLFTTSPQPGMLPNPLFFTLGITASLLHLPLLFIFHSARVLFGFALLWVVWRFLRLLLEDELACRISFLFICFSAGFGWLPLFWPNGHSVNIFHTPVDAWQPEAITFLSLYLSPLFVFSMLLQIGVLFLLMRGEERQEVRFFVAAGLMACLIGLTHTYDIVGLVGTWALFLILGTCSRSGKQPLASWLRAGLTALLALPGTAAIAYELHANPVFHDRAAVPTLSAAPSWVLLGYGGVFCLALYTLYQLVHASQKRSSGPEPSIYHLFRSSDSVLLLLCWGIVQFAVAYLPVSFQRKMLQGEHFPMAILAGVGAAWLLQTKLLPKSPNYHLLAAVCLTLLLSITNIRFVYRDIQNDLLNRVQTDLQRAYIANGEVEALQWIKQHTSLSDAVQPLPWVQLFQSADGTHHFVGPTDMTLACILPGFTGHHVYCGHWGETHNYPEKLKGLVNLWLPTTSDAQRKGLLKQMGVRYLIFSQTDPDDINADALFPIFRHILPLPRYLREVYSNSNAAVYEVLPSKL